MKKVFIVLVLLCAVSVSYADESDKEITGNAGYVVGAAAPSEDTAREPREFKDPITMIDQLIRKIFW